MSKWTAVSTWAIRRLCLILFCATVGVSPTLAQGQSSSNGGSRPDLTSTAAIQINEAPREITFDYLTFEMEKGGHFERSMLTDKIRELDGKKIQLRGYIRPAFKQTGIKNFIFVRDNQECCFGPGAALYDCILVSLQTDKTTDYTVRPITVEGEFYLKEYKGPDGKVWAIFQMRNAIAE